MPPELSELVQLPASMYEIWQVFISLHNSRNSGFQANPIAYSEIQAYYSLYQTVPDAWEIETIKRLDFVVLQIFSDEQEKEQKKRKTSAR